MPARPPDPSYPPADRARIVAEVRKRQEAESISNREMGRILGCSAAVWSQVASGKYTGRSDRWLAAADQWLRDRSHRSGAHAASYVPTSIGARIMHVCSRAWAMPCIGKVVTPSGCGKTAALAEFARRRGSQAVYLQAGEVVSSKRGLLWELAARLTVPLPSRPPPADLARAVRDRLAASWAGGRGSPFCLIVDEATILRPSTLNLLRNFHDDPTCRAAVILADTWQLDIQLASPRLFAGGTEQLRSRLGATFLMPRQEPIGEADVRAVAEAVLRAMDFRGRLPADAWAELVRLAQGDGKLRNVVHRLYAARDVAEAVGARPQFSRRELDYVATLVGAECRMDHKTPPFSGAQPDAAREEGERAA